MGGRSTTWDNKNETMHGYRRSASMRENGSDAANRVRRRISE